MAIQDILSQLGGDPLGTGLQFPSNLPESQGQIDPLAQEALSGGDNSLMMLLEGLTQAQQPQQQQQQGPGGFKGYLQNALGNFIFSLGEGLAAGGGIRGAGVAANAPFRLQELRRQQEQERIDKEEDRKLRRIQVAIPLIQAIGNQEGDFADLTSLLPLAGLDDPAIAQALKKVPKSAISSVVSQLFQEKAQQQPKVVGGSLAIPDESAEGGFRFVTPPAQEAAVPGRDIPFSPEVEAQKARIAGVGRRDFPAEQEANRRFQAEQNALNRVSRLEAAKVAAGAKPATATQLRNASFFYRMKDAMDFINSKPGDQPSIEEQIANLGALGQLGLQFLPNILQSETGQLYRQAQRQFTEARLRKDSGAAIRDEEYEQDAKIYFAVPGDSPKVLERKRAARNNLLEGLRKESGKAVESAGEETGTKRQWSRSAWLSQNPDKANRISEAEAAARSAGFEVIP